MQHVSQVGTPAGISFSDTGLSASTSYSYRVRSTDAAGISVDIRIQPGEHLRESIA